MISVKAKRLKRGIGGLLLIAALLQSAGCVHKPLKSPVAAFSTVASTAVSESVAAFDSVERSYKQTEINALVLNYDTQGFHPESIKPFLKPADREPRIALLKALQKYAETLSAVAGDKTPKAFDQASQDLGNSLLGLNKNEVFKKLLPEKVSDEEVKGVATAVNTIGNWFIESKVRSGLKQALPAMQEPIERLGNLLIADMGNAPDTEHHGGKGLRDQLWLSYDRLIDQQTSWIDHNKDKLDALTKRREIEKLPALAEEQRTADAALAATQETLRHMVETHRELVNAVTSGSASKDDHLDVLIAQLSADGQRAKAFYESLGKK